MIATSAPSAAVLRMRRHRREFTFALEQGVPLSEARARIARQRWEATAARIEQRRARPSLPSSPLPAPAKPQWWQHD